VAVTFDLDDYKSPPARGTFGKMKSIHGETVITAFGIVRWKVFDAEGVEQIVQVPAYYIPNSVQRLLSPQQYTQFHGWYNDEKDCYGGNHKRAWLLLNTNDGNLATKDALMSAPILQMDRIPYVMGY
jgi:hypothetical protein